MATDRILCDALSARFPNADFTPYLAFIESLSIVETGHKHHILPKKEFPEFVKDLNNLVHVSPTDHFKAHYWLALCASECESFQVAFYLMANKRAYQIPEDALPRYVEIFERGRKAQTSTARVNARIQGQKNVESGHLANARKNVRVGHIQTLGRAQGRKNVESGLFTRITTPESCAKGGRIAGRKQFELHGTIATPESRRKGGLIAGYMAAENGQLTKALHVRWHVKRETTNSNCSLCVQAVS